MELALSGREAVTCLLLTALCTATGLALAAWELLRWRRLTRSGAEDVDYRHERWRVIRRTLIALILAVGGPLLGLGWLTIDAARQRGAFIAFWTTAVAVALAVLLLGMLDALIMLRYGLRQSARLQDERLASLVATLREQKSQRKPPWPPPPVDAERN